MSTNKIDKLELVTARERELLAAVRAVRFGSVEVAIHDGRLMQIERRERLRFDVHDRLADHRGPHVHEQAEASGPPQSRLGPEPGRRT